MTGSQVVHIGMLNSYNLLIGKATMSDVVNSNVSLFAHVPDEEIDSQFIDFMILYFQEHEMFEHCAELLHYYKENFNDDGSHKGDECECELPDIKEYTTKIKCSICKNYIRI
jgi:hypothetical protein